MTRDHDCGLAGWLPIFICQQRSMGIVFSLAVSCRDTKGRLSPLTPVSSSRIHQWMGWLYRVPPFISEWYVCEGVMLVQITCQAFYCCLACLSTLLSHSLSFVCVHTCVCVYARMCMHIHICLHMYVGAYFCSYLCMEGVTCMFVTCECQRATSYRPYQGLFTFLKSISLVSSSY